MSRRVQLAGLCALAAILLPGCTSHMPFDENPTQLRIHWRNGGFEQAKKDSKESGKPILAVVAAGDKSGVC